MDSCLRGNDNGRGDDYPRYREAFDLLEQLLQDVRARCLLLADAGGRVMAQLGNQTNLPVEEIVTLLGGGISTIIEVGRSLDNNPDAISLTYREGDHEGLYVVNLVLCKTNGRFSAPNSW